MTKLKKKKAPIVFAVEFTEDDFPGLTTYQYENIGSSISIAVFDAIQSFGKSSMISQGQFIPSDEDETFFGVFPPDCSGADLASMKPDGEDAVFMTEKEAVRWRNKNAVLGRVAEVEETNFGWMEKDSLKEKGK
jgi:hypothetical protein